MPRAKLNSLQHRGCFLKIIATPLWKLWYLGREERRRMKRMRAPPWYQLAGVAALEEAPAGPGLGCLNRTQLGSPSSGNGVGLVGELRVCPFSY